MRKYVLSLSYALVICYHSSHPQGRAGNSQGNEWGFDQSFVGEIPGIKKIAGCGGRGWESSSFTNKQSPQGWAFSGDLLDQKSESRLFPTGGWGLWLQMTSALSAHTCDAFTCYPIS